MQHLFKLHGLSRILKTQFPAGMAIVLGAKDFANRLDNKKALGEACLIIGMCNQQYQLLRLRCDPQRLSSPISNKVWVVVTGQQELQDSNFNIYPVPNDGKFTVSLVSHSMELFTIAVYNQLGLKIHEVKDIPVNGSFSQVIDMRPAVPGIYMVVITNNDRQTVRKIIIRD